jgi:hypothetical protein
MIAFIVINIMGAVAFYWLVRVPKKTKTIQAKPVEGAEALPSEKERSSAGTPTS